MLEREEKSVCMQVCVSVSKIKEDCKAEKGYKRGLNCELLLAIIMAEADE